MFYFSAIVDCSVHITWENTFLGTEDLLLEIYTFLLSKRERASWEDHTENAGMPHFIQLHFTVPHRYHVFHKLKGFGKSALNKSIRTIFPNSICSLHVSVSHLGNSCNSISNVFIITICVCESLCSFR